eukprot:CAMPEP_0169247200 /NCGR_PEP_ID=MMETSP1016-20121227/35152_1 /TAXON_ID=342587 /ORGANISM="Karlodinium micrum, Strain CCMP2283" /LENGTH=283 /DNA_ID=CAMNT_0009327853 /DNA_START=45 /DNA_END=896 /DNA_ORIENTATION=-
MGLQQDYKSTFDRVFGEDLSAPSQPAHKLGMHWPSSCVDQREAAIADRENFGVGFRRAPGAAVSPRIRTRCVQDIILRDRGGCNADVPPPTRASPTTALTKTTHAQDICASKSFTPQTATRILPGIDVFEDRGQSIHRHGSMSPRGRRASPPSTARNVHLKGSVMIEEMLAATACRSRAASPEPTCVGPAASAKKRFPEKTEKYFNENKLCNNQALTVATEAAIIIGEVPVPENLDLRPDQADLNKKLVVRKNATGRTISEWQYRTREVATLRSKEHAKLRWR